MFYSRLIGPISIASRIRCAESVIVVLNAAAMFGVRGTLIVEFNLKSFHHSIGVPANVVWERGFDYGVAFGQSLWGGIMAKIGGR